MFTDMDGNILSEHFTDEEGGMDMESETSINQQPKGVGADMAIDEAARDNSEEKLVSTINNNQAMELENDDIKGKFQYNFKDE